MQSDVIDRGQLLKLTLVVEGSLLLVAACWVAVWSIVAAWIHLAQINLESEFVFTSNVFLIGLVGALATASSGFVILLVGKIFGGSIKWINDLRQVIYMEMAPLFRNLNFSDIALIAAASGFCEEMLFRGVMQVQLGLIPTSILFGLVHCPKPRYVTYGLWAAGAGLFLGWLRDLTGSVWAPIIAHGLSNFIVITYLRYFLKFDPPEPKKVG